MRLATYQYGEETGLGVIIGSQLCDLAASAGQLGHAGTARRHARARRDRPPTCWA